MPEFNIRGLWISTVAVLLIAALQGLSGHWIIFFRIWPSESVFPIWFVKAMVTLSSYHIYAGFATGVLSVVILFFAFASKTNAYVRAFAVVGFIMTALAVIGGVLYVTSDLGDRWSLGQMADAFVGVFGAYFIQAFFMNKTPRFPWSKSKTEAKTP